MIQENELSNKEQSVPQAKTFPIQEQEEAWKILANYQLSIPLIGLLKLVPCLTEKVATLLAQKDVA